MKHTATDLAQMQSLPLGAKIIMTEMRICEWYEHFGGQVYVSFSGGKDSTVLKHMVDQLYKDVPAVFVNTGLEYPEIQKFVRDVKAGKYDCFNSDVEILRPEMRFDEVIKEYGYPVISKEVSQTVYEARKNVTTGKYTYRLKKLNGEAVDKYGKPSTYNIPQWKFLLDSPYKISHKCCDVMKKNPAKKYEKNTGRKPFIATMASESRLRKTKWLKYGCNAFEQKGRKTSQPMSFWTEQDVLEYIVKYDVPYASVYGQIQEETELPGQMYLDGFHNKLCTTGVDRTGCMFCMFGCHLEKAPNRFQKLRQTHPRQYEYCMGGGEYEWEATCKNQVTGKNQKISWINDDGSPMTKQKIEEFVEWQKDNSLFTFKKVWKPTKEGLGLAKVLDYIGVDYSPIDIPTVDITAQVNSIPIKIDKKEEYDYSDLL